MYVEMDEKLKNFEQEYKSSYKEDASLDEKIKLMYEYLLKTSTLLYDVRKKRKAEKKTDKENENEEVVNQPDEFDLINPINVVENNNEPEIQCLFNDYLSDIHYSQYGTVREPWTYVVPTKISLNEICQKQNLQFDHYPFKDARGIYDIHQIRNYQCHDVLADGNCGYRALSYALSGSENGHLELRRRICDHIIRNELPILSTMYPDGIEEAKERRELKPNIPVTQEYWMSTVDIFAASDMLEVNIIVCDERFEWQLHNGTIRDGIANMHMRLDLPTILLDNSSGNHFGVVDRVSLT
ncbi:hypothetical protein FO519_009446 [Halicephalobus sp. NKZ332]|nr:hypothetical protein FO519_009446 [Halicephalobus sp. NKZ332]